MADFCLKPWFYIAKTIDTADNEKFSFDFHQYHAREDRMGVKKRCN